MVLCLVGGGSGCRHNSAAPAQGLPIAAAPTSAAAPDPPPPAATARPAADDPDVARKSLAASYNDPRIVAALARDCAWDPSKDPERASLYKAEGPGDSVDPLLCELEMDQSCVYDPCYQTQEETCKPRCTTTCTSCKTTCKTGCETCKKGCTDASCQKTCATSCAACQQECVQSRDRCATGACTEEYKTCRKDLREGWKRNGCAKICQAYNRCQTRCQKDNEGKEKTWEICKKCAPKKTACNVNLCPGDYSNGINPESDD